ncbi:MAG: S9 family peptidase [Alphaproteobacteria bacterium]|nr:S9 family peptidase [Alphaproteobacteria bacterium]
MTCLRFMVCTSLIGIILGLTDLKADTVTNTLDKNPVYKELLATKNISQLEVSPNKKHLLMAYSQPQIFSFDQETSSQWFKVISVKNNYHSEKNHTVNFPQDVLVFSPMWSPNSQWVSYLGKGDKFLSLWVTPPQEFKPQKIIELENDIIFYRWSPDGKKLAVVENKPSPQDPLKRVYDEKERNLQTLYMIEVNDKLEKVNKTALTSGLSIFDLNVSFEWTPDSEAIVCGYNPESEDKTSNIPRIDLIHVKTKDVRTLVEGEEMDLSVKVSPDGKWVAYTTTNFPGNVQNPISLIGVAASRACLIDLQSAKKHCLAKTPNEAPGILGWKKDGNSLFVVDYERMFAQIYELDLEGKSSVKFSHGEHAIRAAEISGSGEYIGYGASDFNTPQEGYLTSIDSFNPQKVTSLSTSRPQEDFVVEKFQWKSKDKKFDLEGTFIHPQTSQEGTLFPLIIILNNDGNSVAPGYVGDLQNYPLSYLSLLKKGYALFMPTWRGSTGYGVEFRQAIYKELGKGDFEDVMGGIDSLLEKKKVDPHKLALWGWGDGGYLSAWALTQTDRFKTIIVGQGISNLISQVGTTSSPSLLKAVMGEPFWKDRKTWEEQTPISHVKNMNTPTLLQYGSDSEIILASQGEELYFPLKTYGIPVEMITYQGQNDNFTTPHITLLAIQDLEEWLEKYLGPQSKPNVKK